MPIKPIDFQVAVPKTIEASKLQSDQIQKAMSFRQLEVSQMQQRSEEKTRLVQKRENSERVAIHKHGERESKQRDDRKEGGDGGKESGKGKKQGKYGSIVPDSKIDIRL